MHDVPVQGAHCFIARLDRGTHVDEHDRLMEQTLVKKATQREFCSRAGV
jgi:hypothetical protein